MAIFAVVTENECIIERHLHSIQGRSTSPFTVRTCVVYMPDMADDPSKYTKFVFDHFGPYITAEHNCSQKAIK